MCVFCGNIYKNHSSELPKASEILGTGVVGTNQELATYLTTGFWQEWGSSARKFNLTSKGTNSKDGVLTYNTTGNVYDNNGISPEKAVLVDEGFKLLGNTFGIDFQKTTNTNSDIRFSDSYSGAYAYSISSSGNIEYSNINISDTWNYGLNGFGNYTFQTILHEIGHALGLGHQGLYNGSGSYPSDANYLNDSWQSSIMSYFSQTENTSINADYAFLSSFSSVDLIAIDDLYSSQGFSISNAFLGDTIYGFNSNISDSTSQIFSELTSWINTTAFTIADGSGNDTFDFSGFTNNQNIDLRPTEKSLSSLYSSNIAGLTGNLSISAGTIIENAFGGSGNDTITGNSSDNTLNGGEGNDLLIGGTGDDTFVIDSILDTVNENLNEGTDLILTSVSYTLPNNVEKITLTGSLDINATGNDLDNIFKSNSGTNEIDGALGSDKIIFDGLFNDYSLSSSNGNLVVEDNRSDSLNGTTTLFNVEIAEFSDSTKTITELLNGLNIINERNYSAEDLNINDANTSEIIDASAITTLFGLAADANTAYASSGISGLGNEAVTIDDTSIAASVLNTLNSNTTGLVTATAVETVTGTATQMDELLLAEGSGGDKVNLDGDFAITINSGTATVAQVNSYGSATTGVITATISDQTIAALDDLTTSSADQLTITVASTSATASQLTTVAGATGLNVTATAVETVTGTATQMDELLLAEGSGGDKVNLDGDFAITINSGTATVAQVNSYGSATTGVITATISDQTIAALDDLTTSSADQLTITVASTSATASQLTTVAGATGLNVTATAVETVTGTATQMDELLLAEGSGGDKVNLDGDFAITINSGTATVAQVNSYGSATTGVITATISDQTIAALDDLTTSSADQLTITVASTSATASQLTTVAGATGLNVTATAVETVTGTATQMDELLLAEGSGGDKVNLDGDFAITINSGTATVAQVNSYGSATTGVITATISDQTIAALDDLTTSSADQLTITVASTSATASQLTTVAGATGLNVTATAVETVTGTATQMDELLLAEGSGGDKVNLDGDFAITINSGTATVAQVNSYGSATTGVITATISDQTIAALDDLTTSSADQLTITVASTSATASQLTTVAGATGLNVTATAVETVTGTATQMDELLLAEGSGGDKVNLDGDFAITINSGTATVAQVNSYGSATTGVITATISDQTIAALDDLTTSSADQLTITVASTSATASQLTTVAGATGLNVTATAVETVTGTATQMDELLLAEGSGGDKVNLDGDFAITINSGTATVAQVNSYGSATTGVITATISDQTIAALDDLTTSSADQLTITVASTSATASQLTTVAGATGLNVTATAVETVTGTATQMDELLLAEGSGGDKVNLDGDFAITINSGTATVAQVNSYGSATTGVITATISDQTIAALDDLTTSSADQLTITVASTSATASQLTTVAGATGLNVTATAVEAISNSSVAQVKSLLTDEGSTGDKVNLDGNFTVAINDTGTVNAADLNTINSATSGLVTATGVATLTGTASAITTLIGNEGNSGDKVNLDGDFAVTVDAGTATVAQVNSYGSATTGVITATISDQTIAALDDLTTSSADQLTITVASTSATASQLTTVAGATGLNVTATAVQTVTDSVSEITTLLGVEGSSGDKVNLDSDYLVTITDTGSVAASDLSTINAATSGLITATSVATLTGTAEAINTLVGNEGDSGDKVNLDSDYVATLSDTTITATVLNAVDGNVPGTVNASTVGTITGSAADINTAYASSGFSGLGDEAVTIDDTSIAASVLNTLNSNTTGLITATSVATLTGTAEAINTLVGNEGDSGDKVNLDSDYVATLSDTTITATVLNAVDGNVPGTVNASTVGTITGSAADINTAYESSGISGLGNEALTVSGTLTVSQANAIGELTTGAVTATISDGDMTTLAGLSANSIVPHAHTITVTDTSVAATTLNTLEGKTSVAIDGSAITTITGTLSDINTAYASSRISGLGNESVTLTDTSLAADALNTSNTNTTGTVTVQATTVTGTAGNLVKAYGAKGSGIIGLGNEDVTVSYGSASVSQVNTLTAATTGTVTATVSDGDMTTLAGISESGSALTVIVKDTSIAADALNTLDSKTTVAVSVNSTTITGSVSDICSAYGSLGISGLGNETITSSGTLTVAQANTLVGLTTGAVTSKITNGDMTTLAGLSETGHAHTITVTDTSVVAIALNTLDSKTTAAIDASAITTITGTGADALTAFESEGIKGLTFDAASYLASYSDLLSAFGSDTSAAQSHYFALGVSEGRSFDSFDETSYLASHTDLLSAFGTNTTSALSHYINFGFSELRSTDSFNEFSYIASHSDLIKVLGANGEEGTAHYVAHGYSEGRTIDSFNEWGYLASYSDLITAFGTDITAATKHYISFGYGEGRTITFDAESYLNKYQDLKNAFGNDMDSATKHYVEYGFNEGRAF